jgi:pimeloyl-ACP methyl ester carboxylesterase
MEDIDDVVFHYVELLDELHLDRVSVVGTSIGGWIAAELALLRPDRVERLVLAAAAGIKIDGVERFDVFLHPIEDTLQHLFHDPSRVAQLLPTQFGPEVIIRAYNEATSLARLSWNPYLYSPKLERRLRRIVTPTLVIWGANDRFLPIAHGHAYAERIQSAQFCVIPDCGHLIPLEKTEQFVERVTAFLGLRA